jgi:hypothetical protein
LFKLSVHLWTYIIIYEQLRYWKRVHVNFFNGLWCIFNAFLQAFFLQWCMYASMYVCSDQILQLNFEAGIFNRLSWNFVYTFNLDNAWFTMWRYSKSNSADEMAHTKWRTCYFYALLQYEYMKGLVMNNSKKNVTLVYE